MGGHLIIICPTMILIKRWLAGDKNFIAGVVLYKKYGNNQYLKDILEERGETIENIRLLEKSLSEIVDPAPEIATIIPSLPPQNNQITKLSYFDNMPISDDLTLTTLQQSWKRKYSEMNMLRHQLDAFENNQTPQIQEKAKEICFKILFLEKEINKIWEQRDYYITNGILPQQKEKKQEIPTDPVKLALAIESTKKGLRRNKAALKKNPDDIKIVERIRQYDDRLKNLTNTPTN